MINKLIKKDFKRQKHQIILNAALSECPKNVKKALCSNFVNVDAEGSIPTWLREKNSKSTNFTYKEIQKEYKQKKDKRSNKCCENFNIIEFLAQDKLKEVFANELVKKQDIFVNVQAPTGAIANLIAILTFAKLGDTIVSMNLVDGGHLSHGSALSFVGQNFNVKTYGTNKDGDLDYKKISELLKTYKPAILIAGASSYPRTINWQLIREIINEHSPKTIFFADISHTAGLVAGKVFPSPFGYADVITMVGYKTFCGARAGAIFCFNKENYLKISRSCFPYIMGSPLGASIAGLAVSAENALKPSFQRLQSQIVKNAQTFERILLENGFKTCNQGTSTHIVLLDLKASGIKLTGEEAANKLEDNNILVNKNMIVSDTKNSEANGIRFGFTISAQRGYSEKKIEKIAQQVILILKN